MPALRRLTFWGSGAAGALAVAVITSASDSGSRRSAMALGGETPRQVTAAELIPRPGDLEGERRRLNEAIRLLTADRDRLLTRIGAIERNLDDVTGSINRQATPLPAIANSQTGLVGTTRNEPVRLATAPAVAAPETRVSAPRPAPVVTPGLPTIATEWMVNAAAPWPNFPPAPATASDRLAAEEAAQATSTATRTEFGVDIGGGATLDEVRQLWNAFRTQHARLLAGVRPIVSLREEKNGGLDLRLVVGPLANARAAAKLCAALSAADVLCSTKSFDGQRLAVR